MVNKLYGDGIHDDYSATQEMIDNGVFFPVYSGHCMRFNI